MGCFGPKGAARYALDSSKQQQVFPNSQIVVKYILLWTVAQVLPSLCC